MALVYSISDLEESSLLLQSTQGKDRLESRHRLQRYWIDLPLVWNGGSSKQDTRKTFFPRWRYLASTTSVTLEQSRGIYAKETQESAIKRNDRIDDEMILPEVDDHGGTVTRRRRTCVNWHVFFCTIGRIKERSERIDALQKSIDRESEDEGPFNERAREKDKSILRDRD